MTENSGYRNTQTKQRARIFRVATLAAGVFIHLVVCWAVLSAGYMTIDTLQFLGLASLSAAGFLFLALLIAFEWNLSFEDPELALPQMLWAITIVILTAHFVVDLRAAVLLTGLALVILGCNRLTRREQAVFGSYAMGLYGMSVFYSSQQFALSWPTEAVVMIAFGLVLVFGPVLYRFEAGVMEDVLVDKNQELSVALTRIRELAIRDELTGAYNRRHLMEVLNHEKALSDRGGYGFSLCYIDLDFFKRINDRFGHGSGDQVLVNFADIARQALREVDCVARMGGEEFLLVLAGTTAEASVAVTRRIVAGLKALPVSPIEPAFRVTASMGVAEYRLGETIQMTLERADKALYDAKRTGRNKIVLADMPERLSIG